MDAPITKAQISRIWAAANELSLSRDELYSHVPGKSISRLTRRQASDLIERLEAMRAGAARSEDRRTKSAPSAPATPEQIHFIYYLFGRLGWLRDPQHMANFLRKYFHVDRVEDLPNRKRASAVIEALKAIATRRGRLANDESNR